MIFISENIIERAMSSFTFFRSSSSFRKEDFLDCRSYTIIDVWASYL